MDNSKKAIGLRIRNARQLRDLTQEDLALLVGLSRVSIVNIESGRQSPPLLTMIKIAQKLNKPLTHFARVKGDDVPELEFYLPLSVHKELDNIPLNEVRSFIAFRRRIKKNIEIEQETK